MTGRSRRWLASVVLAIAVSFASAACVHYPNVRDVGGTKIIPSNGRIVREPDGGRFYVDLDSTGKYGDTIVAVITPAAQQAHLVSATGERIERLRIPPVSHYSLSPGNPYAVLVSLSPEIKPLETIIVTLVFEKLGHVGVVTVVE